VRRGDACVLRFSGACDGEAVVIVDVQHDMHVGAAIAHVDHPIGSYAEPPSELLDHGDLTVAGRDPLDGLHLSGYWVEIELRAVDMVRGENAAKRRGHDLKGRCGDDVEGEAASVQALLQETHQRGNGLLETHPLAGLHQVFPTHAAELGIVPNEIGKLAALLDGIAPSEARHALLLVAPPGTSAHKET